MSKYFKRINIPISLFIIALLLFILIIPILSIKETFEASHVTRHSTATHKSTNTKSTQPNTTTTPSQPNKTTTTTQPKPYDGTNKNDTYHVISYADSPGNDIGIVDVTDISGNWTINTNQQINGIDYSGQNCRNVCDNLAGCAGYLFTTNTETTGSCIFKSSITDPQLNQNFNYFLNVK
jgi:hypothetical protein